MPRFHWTVVIACVALISGAQSALHHDWLDAVVMGSAGFGFAALWLVEGRRGAERGDLSSTPESSTSEN